MKFSFFCTGLTSTEVIIHVWPYSSAKTRGIVLVFLRLAYIYIELCLKLVLRPRWAIEHFGLSWKSKQTIFRNLKDCQENINIFMSLYPIWTIFSSNDRQMQCSSAVWRLDFKNIFWLFPGLPKMTNKLLPS